MYCKVRPEGMLVGFIGFDLPTTSYNMHHSTTIFVVFLE